jgi:Arc/MetJ-type ribon-helix-helix transcriptional regulator
MGGPTERVNLSIPDDSDLSKQKLEDWVEGAGYDSISEALRDAALSQLDPEADTEADTEESGGSGWYEPRD